MIILKQGETLIDYIKKQVHVEKRTYTILITGKRQMRKSTTAIRLADELDDKGFDMKTQLAVADSEEVLEVLGRVRGRGKVVVIDEMGIAAGHREWFTSLNKSIDRDFQMHGFRGLIVIVTAPQERFVDIDVRGMFDMNIHITYKSEKLKFVKAKIEERINIPKAKKEPYGVFIRKKCADGTTKRIDRFKIFFPLTERMKEYFAISMKRKEDIHDSDIYKLKSKRLKVEKEVFNPNFFANKIKEKPDKFLKTFGKKIFLSRPMIMSEFNVSDIRARQIKDIAEQEMGIGYAAVFKGNKPIDRKG